MILTKAPFDGLRVVSKVEPQRAPKKRIKKVFFAVLAVLARKSLSSRGPRIKKVFFAVLAVLARKSLSSSFC